MCGLVGVVTGHQQKRRVQDIDALIDIFTAMLLLSEHRGPHATGVAWVKRDGSLQVAKEPLPARQFVRSGTYLDWLMGVDREMTYLMGHTRWPSRGSARNHAENHPLDCALPILLTHNGTILEHGRHLARLHLRQSTRVDSELLARMAQHHTGPAGMEFKAFLDELAPLAGSMTLAMVATTRPEEILLLKGNMPLDVRLQPRRRVLAYASEAPILDRALTSESGWETLPLAYGEGLVVYTDSYTLQRVPFTFQGLNNMARYAGGSGCTAGVTRSDE